MKKINHCPWLFSTMPLATAQLYISGIGIRAGKFNTGITSKFFFYADNNTGMQFDAYYTNIASGGYTLKAFYVNKFLLKFRSFNFLWILFLVEVCMSVIFPMNHKVTIERSRTGCELLFQVSCARLVLMQLFRSNIRLKKIAPFTIGIDAVPYFEFINQGPEFIDFGVSVRYVFR